MKNIILISLTCSTLYANGQIYTQAATNGSIIITPKGLSGKANSTGEASNASIGANALLSNTTGYNNTAGGTAALYANTTGYLNTANGYFSLPENTTGSRNTATGALALFNNTTGEYNTANGVYSLSFNTTGSNNAAIGFQALYSNTEGHENAANGTLAGYVNVSGNNNTYIGYNANPLVGNFSNATAIGANAIVNASNKVRIGDTTVTIIEGQVPWSNPSDRRLKENILYTSRLGLDFITRLQTVSYNYTADKNKNRYDGFIAQDIEKAMQDLNIPFSGLKKSEDGRYSLAYSDFVVPLVNAVKEQQKEISDLRKQLEMLARKLNAMEESKTEAVLKNTGSAAK